MLLMVVVLCLLIGCKKQEKPKNIWEVLADEELWKNMEFVKADYQDAFSYSCDLEKKYGYNGSYAVDTLSFPCDNDTIGRFELWFPTELKTTQHQWPLVIMANGTGVLASKYQPIFRHLASWGFIVAGNEDENTWWGRSVSATLDFLLAENRRPESLFFGKVDTTSVGLAGHSQGGIATFTASTMFPNSCYYKAICAMSGNAKEAVNSIQCPLLLICGTEGLDEMWKQGQNETFDTIFTEIPVVSAYLKDTDHGKVLPRGDAYMTAWMRYWLCDDTMAAHCFVGADAEIFRNKDWQDVRRKNLP
jgi:dienelactone hydrolase